MRLDYEGRVCRDPLGMTALRLKNGVKMKNTEKLQCSGVVNKDLLDQQQPRTFAQRLKVRCVSILKRIFIDKGCCH